MQYSQIVTTFINLCKIPTPSGREEQVRLFIIDQLKKYSSSVFTDKIGNLFMTIPGDKKGKPLLLCAHMDTVMPAGLKNPVIKQNTIFSDGENVLGADNKASVAAIIETIKSLKEEKISHVPLELLFTVQEETAGGITQFPRKKITAKECIMADFSSAQGEILSSAPFVIGYSVTVPGTSSHAKYFTSDTQHPLSYFLAFTKEVPFGRLSEETIVNIALLKMGENYNNIPSSLYFTGEIRTFHKDVYDRFIATLTDTVKHLNKQFQTKAKLELFPYCRGFHLAEKDLAMMEQVMKKIGPQPQIVKDFGVGDHNVLNNWGITTINVADGSKNAHTPHESISIQNLENLQKICTEYVKAFSEKRS